MYNNSQWTDARFHSFIKGGLRQISSRWPPKHDVKKAARLSRGIYLCAGYEVPAHKVVASLPPLPGNKRRINNAQVDHIIPVIEKCFTNWDDVIKHMFCEAKDLQVLCNDCHKRKTKDERIERERINKRWKEVLKIQ